MRFAREIKAWIGTGCCVGLLLSPCGAGAVPSLAQQLADEGDWEACRRECRRTAFDSVNSADMAQLLEQADQAQKKGLPALSVWKRVGALPVLVMVKFYRGMVAPALGSRCLLEPSCSHYSMQAARERGWLGIPMTGDRLIREPSVVVARETPIEDDAGYIHFSDPVSDHIGGACRNRCER